MRTAVIGLLCLGCLGCSGLLGTTDYPEPVTDFVDLMNGTDSVTLTWTAPSAEEGKRTRLSSYEFRYALSAMSTREDWDSAISITVSLRPRMPGEREYLTLPFPAGSRECYLGIRTVNAAGTKSQRLDRTYVQPSPSSAAPAFTTDDFSGVTRASGEWIGQVPTLVNFWASWCGPCRDEMPDLITLYDEVAPKGVAILGMACESDSASAHQYVDYFHPQWPQLNASDSLRHSWGVRAYPTTVFIYADGKVLGRMVGSRSVEIFRLGVQYLLLQSVKSGQSESVADATETGS
jgi:thiol-disulfide isomerase/thioredoxin